MLADLYVNLTNRQGHRTPGPPVHGVIPTKADQSYHPNNLYRELNQPIDYSGAVLLADGFIQELYRHMGFHPAWKYKTVLELVFDSGVLTEQFDRSERIAELRDELATNAQRSSDPKGPLSRFEGVGRAFDRSYPRL